MIILIALMHQFKQWMDSIYVESLLMLVMLIKRILKLEKSMVAWLKEFSLTINQTVTLFLLMWQLLAQKLSQLLLQCLLLLLPLPLLLYLKLHIFIKLLKWISILPLHQCLPHLRVNMECLSNTMLCLNSSHPHLAAITCHLLQQCLLHQTIVDCN